MPSNPFRATLAILGIGLLVTGALLWSIGTSVTADPQSVSTNGPGLVALGGVLLGIGWVPFVGWLVVRAIQHVPAPPKPRDAAADAEIAAYLAQQRDPNAR